MGSYEKFIYFKLFFGGVGGGGGVGEVNSQ